MKTIDSVMYKPTRRGGTLNGGCMQFDEVFKPSKVHCSGCRSAQNAMQGTYCSGVCSVSAQQSRNHGATSLLPEIDCLAGQIYGIVSSAFRYVVADATGRCG